MGTITAICFYVFGRSDKKRQEGPRVFWGGNVTVEVVRYLANFALAILLAKMIVNRDS